MTPDAMAICTVLVNAAVTLAGIIATSKLTTYRIEQLEKKVDKHNTLIERMVVVEQSTKSAHHRIDDLVHELGVTEPRRED